VNKSFLFSIFIINFACKESLLKVKSCLSFRGMYSLLIFFIKYLKKKSSYFQFIEEKQYKYLNQFLPNTLLEV